MDYAKHWQDRAAIMRALSESMADPEAKALMLKLAERLRQAGG
jgi:hypothetical protein